MLFKDFVSEVKRRTLRDFSSADFDPFVKRWVNRAMLAIATEAKWRCLRLETTITTEADEEEYVLDYRMGKLAFLWHRALGYNYKMESVPEVHHADSGEVGTTTGYPYWYRIFEANNVVMQPPVASQLTVVSDDADDNSQKIRIMGGVNGVPDGETVDLDGTTPVTTELEFTDVTDVFLDTTLDGKVTITDDSANVIAVISPGLGRYSIKRKHVKMYYIPDAVYSVFAYGYRKIFFMDDDYDAPPFPEEFDEAIILKALQISIGGEEYDHDNAKKIWLDYKDIMRTLKADNMMDDPWIPLLQSFRKPSRQSHRYLNFGPHFPVFRY